MPLPLLAFSDQNRSASRALLQIILLSLTAAIQIIYGLLTRRQVEIPQNKVKLLKFLSPGYDAEWDMPPLTLKPLHWEWQMERRKSEGLVPMLSREEIPQL